MTRPSIRAIDVRLLYSISTAILIFSPVQTGWSQPTASPAPPASTNITSSPADDAGMEVDLAVVMAQQNKTDEAIRHYRRAISLYREQLQSNPDSADLLNRLSWLLGTNPNTEIRDGKEAVKLAQRACELTQSKRAAPLATLAAAQAEDGQFDSAIKTAKKARELAMAEKDKDLTARTDEFIKLFQSHRAYHEPY